MYLTSPLEGFSSVRRESSLAATDTVSWQQCPSSSLTSLTCKQAVAKNI